MPLQKINVAGQLKMEIMAQNVPQIGIDRAGVLESSFVAEVKSDLMGEQTILCGMLQAGALLCYDKMTASGIDKAWAVQLIQYGWETITEALKVHINTLWLATATGFVNDTIVADLNTALVNIEAFNNALETQINDQLTEFEVNLGN